ncbi:hypothetical protein IY33_26110 [Escherichia coli]|nr:hypothetical protein IY33_26110 [Escherichia coli]
MTQHIVPSAAESAPHVVMTGGGVVWGERKILNNEFSDLRKREEGLLYEWHKKRRIVAVNRLLLRKQNL